MKNHKAWWVWALLLGIVLVVVSVAGFRSLPPAPQSEEANWEEKLARWERRWLLLAGAGGLGVLLVAVGFAGGLYVVLDRVERRITPM